MTTNRLFCNILTDDLPRARRTYTQLFGLEVAFDSDWFVQLSGTGGGELGLLRRDHETVPTAHRQAPSGVVLTFVVDAVEPVLANARRLALEVVAEPHDTEYGLRRALLRDADGTLIDVSAPVAPLASGYR